jgi:hypothetical protein
MIGQVELEELIFRRRELMELEEGIASALSCGASVEDGVHTARLVPERRDGFGRELFLKLVITIFLLAVIPGAHRRRSLFEDLNGDGKVDFADIELELSSPGGSLQWEKAVANA